MNFISKKGFTLVEVLVILVITTLFSIMVAKSFLVINAALIKAEESIKNRNTINLVFEHYRSVEFKRLRHAEDVNITRLFISPSEKRDLKIYLTIKNYKTTDMKIIKVRAVWGNANNPFMMELKTIRYRYGI